ncbi:MAG: UDP-N-acetylmuramate--L-alanine ligase [Dehalococcoidia bacterium]|nr:UDP-N-acetylmuramate--L-alanine ligase [Dehalococcoidia bacterium]MCB9485434.1 UDP-N-acetylmuramate--L-alanine ligase [Thermoflexaceae bacterium]
MSEIGGPVHLVGIGGMHMSAIGQLLLERGVAVSGSDLRASAFTDRLGAMGARVVIGEHAAGNVGDAALVVTTAAAADDNPELAEARRRGIPLLLRAEMVARLMEGKRVIAVAGAHGKTTTSSMIAFILVQAGRRPMYLLGGESIDLGGHAAWGEGDLCVVEADEYRRAFHEYEPAVAVVTNVEADHLDYYRTAAAYHEAFEVFARKIVEGGTLIACWDDAGARAVSEAIEDGPVRVESYGTEGTRFWQATDVAVEETGAAFTLRRGGGVLGRIHLRHPGMHVVRNATAAAAVCVGLGVPFETVAEALGNFHGARRRFETVGEAAGVLVMDDYAHHPTEVRATLTAARGRFAGRRIIGVYQPHTYSRISYLWDEWTACWEGLDELIVLETYAAREVPVAGRSARDLVAAITRPTAHYAKDFEDAATQAAALARPGDVVFTIGAGDVVDIGPMLLERLR